MTRARKLLILLAGVPVVLVAGLVAVVLLIDVDDYRGMIEERAENALGRDVRLGAIGLSLFPLGVRVDDIGVARRAEEGEGEMITARSLRVGARLMPLIGRRLEITGVVLQEPSISLSRDAAGRWNVQSLFAAQDSSAPEDGGGGLPKIAVESVRITNGTMVYRDAALHPGRVFETTIKNIDLRIRDLEVDRPVRVELSAVLDALPGAALGFDGQIGPLAGDSPLRVAGDLDAEDVDPERLGALLVDAGVLQTVPPGFFGGRAVDLSCDIDATWAAPPSGTPTIDIAKLDLDLDGSTLEVRGRLAGDGPVYDADLQLLPSRVKAEHITSLLALAMGEVPVSFASRAPVEIEARLKGRVGDGGTPDVAGTAKLRDFTFEHPGLARPVEQLRATVSIGSERLEISDFGAVIGSSDVSGELTLVGFTRPRVGFAIRSRHADFFELFSFISPSKPAGGPSPEGDAAAEELARSVTVDGTLEIAEGTFQKLDFTDLSAAMAWSGGELRLDPCRMRLYDGGFEGRLTYVPFSDPPRFDVGGAVQSVEVGAILADTLAIEGLLSGKFSGEVAGHGSGAAYESIVRSFDGGGSIGIESGRLGRLDVLSSLSTVTGIFGEQTLSSLSRELGTEGTDFGRAVARIRVFDGKMQFQDLTVEAPAFALRGDGTVNLLDEQLRGTLAIVFSEQVSASMRDEGSRAGAVFFNPESGRVEFPFTLSGPYTAPSAGVDWKGALGSVAKRAGTRELRGILEDKLGLKQDAPAAEPSELGGAGDGAAPGASATGPGGLAVEISRADWSGSLLLQDLKLQGTVRGSGIDRASLEAVDASGAALLRVDRLKDVEAYLVTAADRQAPAEIRWKAKVDGKKIAMAKMPVTVVVRVYNGAGDSVEVTRQVDR
jgi:uncharacterized protein involved in outer membrane biogenesis